MSLLLRSIIIPLTATLSLTGFPPALYPIGLQLVGYAPTVSQSTPTLSITPDAGSLVLTGAASTLNQGIIPQTGTLVFIGQTPTVIQNNALIPTAGTLTLTGRSPLLSHTIVLSPGDLMLTGKAPTVTTSGGGPATSLHQRAIRGTDATGLDDWWISYQA